MFFEDVCQEKGGLGTASGDLAKVLGVNVFIFFVTGSLKKFYSLPIWREMNRW